MNSLIRFKSEGMEINEVKHIIKNSGTKYLQTIAEKIFEKQRISEKDAIALYENADLGWLGVIASHVKNSKSGDEVYYNRNFHIEPTNICLYQCKFCSYKRKEGEQGSWEFSVDDIIKKVSAYKNIPVTEVHIVGGVHPKRDLHYYGNLLSEIKAILPWIHIKAFTVVELDFMIKKAGLQLEEGLKILKAYGLDSIPGGGAEIFNPEIRQVLCPEKPSGERWLFIHRAAHKTGILSNATMLYGHLEKYHHRVEHMKMLRDLQDETKGFNAFIPLKFRKANNYLAHLGEISVVEDLKNYAIARLFFDNIAHLKAYWPMIGKEITKTSLSFGVDDIDGTIDDSTKIYSMAGVNERNEMTVKEMEGLIRSTGKIPVERDSLYRAVGR
jgi:aminodeoxyfutalosine synthase